MSRSSSFRGFRGFNSPNNTQVPDELFDEIMVHLSGAELKVLLYVIRRTYGFKRESDNISLSQMLTGIVKRDGNRLDFGTGLSKPTLLSAIRSLAEKGMIVPERRRSTERGDEATTYRLRLVTDNQTTGSPHGEGSTEEDESEPPVVKKLAQGEAGTLPTPVGKVFAQAVVKKSAPQVTVTNNQENKVVNDVTANDQKSTPQANRPSTRPPVISDRALRRTYDLADNQIGRVHWLVDKQGEILGALDRNHAAYVKRAAEAVRDGFGDSLDFKLSDFKQAATEIAVGSRPAYFHAMWTEETENRRHPTTPVASDEPQPSGNSPGNLFDRPQAQPTGIDPRITRMIIDAERHGFAVPDYIRTADLQAVNRWWAALADATR